MTLILFMMLMAFALVVFGGLVVQLFATMNGWGFLALLAILFYLWFRNHRWNLKWKARNRP